MISMSHENTRIRFLHQYIRTHFQVAQPADVAARWLG